MFLLYSKLCLHYYFFCPVMNSFFAFRCQNYIVIVKLPLSVCNYALWLLLCTYISVYMYIIYNIYITYLYIAYIMCEKVVEERRVSDRW